MAQGTKQGIAKTIRGAVETYDGFVSTFMALETAPDLNKKWRFSLSENSYIGHTALTSSWARFLVLRAYVRGPVLARRETEFCTIMAYTKMAIS